MAENKKSFIAYTDWGAMFQELPDDVAGKLIKHIFAYVNDESPATDDFVINALFAQVKSTLKRDLAKWDNEKKQRSEAGRKSAEKRSTKSNDRSIPFNENQRKPTVNVSVNVNDSVNDNAIKKSRDLFEEDIQSGKSKKPVRSKKEFVPPTESQMIAYFIENGYSKELAQKAYRHYSVGDWKDANGKQVLNWKQKVQGWFRPENLHTNPQNRNYNHVAPRKPNMTVAELLAKNGL